MNYLLPKIPSPYKLVEYIESSGTQWIDLGFAPNQTTKATCNFTYYTDSNTYNVIFGCREQYRSKQFMAWVKSDDTSHGIRIDYANAENIYGQRMSQTPAGAVANNTYLTYELGHAYFKCPELGINHTFPDDPSYQGDFTCTRNLYLFARNQSGPDWYCSAKVYRFTAEHNGSIIREMYPVKNNTTNEYGMYDVINKQFYGNNGTGSFTGGNIIQQVEYLRSANGVSNTVINTGVKLDYYSRVESKFIEINSPNNNFLYGAREAYSIKAFAFFQGWAAFGSDTGGSGAGTVFPIGVPTEFKQDNTGFYINGVLARTYNETEFETPVNCSIFNCTQGSEGSYYRTQNNYADCYYFKIYKNNVLVRSFIPIVINNEYGMIDLVEFKVYLNAGTGTFTGGNVVPMYVTKEFLFDKKVGILPSGYTQLEYIESSGTQYIDTGVMPIENDEIELQNVVCVKSSANQTIFSAGTGVTQLILLVGASAPDAYFKYFASGGAKEINTNLNTPKNIVANSTGIYYNSALQVTSSYENSVNTNLFLFRRADGSSYATAKIGEVKLKRNDSLVRNLIPAQRISDSVIGMYDTVSGTFFTNSGTGTFTAGPEITSNTYISVKTVSRLPQGYKELSYLEANSGPYINLGIKYNSHMSFKLKYNRQNMGDSGSVILSTTTTTPLIYFPALNGGTTQERFVWRRGGYSEQIYTLNFASYPQDIVEAHLDYESDTLSINGTTVLTGMISAMGGRDTAYESNDEMCLWTTGGGSYKSYSRVYYLQITQDGNDVMNLVPAKNSSNVLGMYDTVTNTFYTNSGTGTFTAGNEVHNTQLYLSIKEA